MILITLLSSHGLGDSCCVYGIPLSGCFWRLGSSCMWNGPCPSLITDRFTDIPSDGWGYGSVVRTLSDPSISGETVYIGCPAGPCWFFPSPLELPKLFGCVSHSKLYCLISFVGLDKNWDFVLYVLFLVSFTFSWKIKGGDPHTRQKM